MPTQSKYYSYQQASLSQKISFNIDILRKLAGSDQQLSDSIAILTYISDPKKEELLKKDSIKWILGLLDVLRLSHFATSEKTNEISKLGFMLPRQDEEEDWAEDESG